MSARARQGDRGAWARVSVLAFGLAACGAGEAPLRDAGLVPADAAADASAPDAAARPPDAAEVCGLNPPVWQRLSVPEIVDSLALAFPHKALRAEDRQRFIDKFLLDPAGQGGFSNNGPGRKVQGDFAEHLFEVGEWFTADPPFCGAVPAETCVADVVERVGQLLFRRPLEAEERDSFAVFWRDSVGEAGAQEALSSTLLALVMSPEFVYRGQQSQADLAWLERMSFGLEGRGPSEAALTEVLQAGAGARARDLIESALSGPVGRQHLLAAFSEWLRVEDVLSVAKTEPFAEELRRDLVEETRRFVAFHLLEARRPISALLTETRTFLNARLRAHYGLDGATNAPAEEAAFSLSVRPQGAGLWAQGALLASLGLPNGTSPTRRGAMIRTRWMCDELPPALPGVMPPAANAADGLTTRARYETVHAADPSCADCHRFVDPLGFALEGFDGLGRPRSHENGLPLDLSGQVWSLDDDSVERSFDGPQELFTWLANDERWAHCAAWHLLAYLVPDHPEEGACLLPGLAERLHAGTPLLDALVETFALQR
ncbi:MAG: DUF1588 domain-containing protein [Myxococcales bacterium]|nr:DUF1588 domain-containing protein [Myxococcales bacterium]